MSSGAMDPAEFYGTLRSYRQRIGALLDEARERFLHAMQSDSNVLTWYGERFWVDRVRWLVLPLFDLEPAAVGHTHEGDGEGGEINEKLAMYGDRRAWISAPRSRASSAPCWQAPRSVTPGT
jgi:hypothetical protein